MSSPSTINSSIRRIISFVAVLCILGVFLCIYFLRYVPQRKGDYNKRAFVELQSVTESFNTTDQAFLEVVKSLSDKQSMTSLNELLKAFPRNGFKGNCSMASFEKRLHEFPYHADATLDRDPSTGQLDLIYTVSLQHPDVKKTCCDTLRLKKSIDSMLSPLTAGDNDIFDSYLVILDNGSYGQRSDSLHLPKGEIVFNSSSLSIDFQVNVDTLLKKSDGFSLPGISDVNIEGNDYKLFLRPFRLHGYRAIMAGLLSQEHYTQRYESVPVELITTGSILLLLFLVALPLLKVYLIGPNERITRFDVRTVVGAYFIGAAVLFLLFAGNFVKNAQTEQHRARLTAFAGQLCDSLSDEIHAICGQLKRYDQIYRLSQLHKALTSPVYDTNNIRPYDTLLHPGIYRQFDVIFWVNNHGRLTGRYALKKYGDVPLVSVEDRDYFRDLNARHPLILPLKDSCRSRMKKPAADSFCLQPTLDKLDGNFVMNLVIPITPSGKDSPVMVGASGKPWSVYNTALPPGYGFSIVDDKRKILFDSRGGRHLLSNISMDLGEDDPVAQCIAYRKERFLKSTTIHGDRVAMLVTPFTRLPYIALVYYNLETPDRFQVITLGLTGFFVGSLILLLVFSALCNEWGRSAVRFSAIPPINFDWLRPKPEKDSFYRRLLLGTGVLAAAWVLFCLLFERISPQHEFVLFIASLLFPFYIAIYYYLLREKQNNPSAHFRQTLPLPALAVPLLVIFTVMIYLLTSQLEWESKAWIIGFQLGFACLLGIFYQTFQPLPSAPSITAAVLLRRFSRTVVTGIVAVVLIPAIGIFSFFYKEETRTMLKQDMLDFANSIALRSDGIAEDKSPSKYFLDSAKTDRAYLDSVKRWKGIYYVDNPAKGETPDSDQASPHHLPVMYYVLRNFIFPTDTTMLAHGTKPELAGDSSWYFSHTKTDSELLVRIDVRTGDSNRVYLPRTVRQSALKLLLAGNASLGWGYTGLLILTVIVLVILFHRLTSSLANRIFLLQMLDDDPGGPSGKDPLSLSRPLLADYPQIQQKLQPAETTDWSASGVLAKEKKYDFVVPYVQYELQYTYKAIWDGLSSREKFVLYDFAVDGLANYKAGTTLFNLIQKGILCVKERQLQFMTLSFQNFVLDRSGDKIIVQQMKRAKTQGSWQNLRIPFLLFVAAAGIFVFLTQEAVYQKITGLFTSLGSLAPLVTQFLGKGNK